jgi:WD40 repeat protein
VAVLLAVAALAVSTVLAWRANQDLQQALDRERDALEREQYNGYLQRIALAEREWSANNLARMQQVLEECPPELRGWEWHYLNRLRYNTLAPLRHDATVLGAMFSPDSRRIASADQDGWVKLWDAKTGRGVLEFRAHPVHARSVAFSPDGRRLATGSWDGTVKVWDPQALKKDPSVPPLLTLTGYKHRVRQVAFSPDGQRLAAASGQAQDGKVHVWDLATGAQVLAVPAFVNAQKCFDLSADGQRVVAIGPEPHSEVKVWDARAGQILLTFRGHTQGVLSVAFSPDGRLVASATGSTNGTVPLPGAEILLWDAETGRQIQRLRGHTGGVNCVAFSRDGRRLASASQDHTVKLWDVRTGRDVLTLRGHAGQVCVAFSPDGHGLVAGTHDRTVRRWDATPAEGRPDPGCLTLAGHGQSVNSVAFHPKNRGLLASAGGDGTIRLWDTGTGEQERTLSGHGDLVQGLAFGPDGQRLAAACQKKVRVWDTATWQEVFPTPLTSRDAFRTVAFSPDGQVLAAGGPGDFRVALWDAFRGDRIRELSGHNWAVWSVAFSPGGRRLAAASFAGTVRIWDVSSGQEVVSPALRHEAAATGVAFSPDGQRLVSGSLDGTVRMWDTGSWRPSLLIRSDATVGVWCVAFSPGARRLAWGSTDATIKIADVSTGEIFQTLRGHSGWVQSIAFSPDGSHLASASADGTVKVWDTPHEETVP